MDGGTIFGMTIMRKKLLKVNISILISQTYSCYNDIIDGLTDIICVLEYYRMQNIVLFSLILIFYYRFIQYQQAIKWE